MTTPSPSDEVNQKSRPIPPTKLNNRKDKERETGVRALSFFSEIYFAKISWNREEVLTLRDGKQRQLLLWKIKTIIKLFLNVRKSWF